MPQKSIHISFEHRQTAHCESGVTANLLSHAGVALSEAMAFGIGGGLFFGYFPFIRVYGLPLTTFRNNVGGIFSRTAKRLGIGIQRRKFRDQRKAEAALDAELARGTPVALQTGMYWLEYFPKAYRFHFNAHNLVVYGREGDDYLISDPVLQEPVRCPAGVLQKARFAHGLLAPKGKMFHLKAAPDEVNIPKAVYAGLKDVEKVMRRTPVPYIGVRGIRMLAKQLERWPARLDKRKASLYLGHIIRMQEEIGTGGAGFRFLYAAFLQEAAELLDEKRLFQLSREMTDVGDVWRQFALQGARDLKGRSTQPDVYPQLATILRECAEREESIFKQLGAVVSALKRRRL